MTFNSNTFSGNTAIQGGAIYLDGSEASFSFSDNDFIGNTASNGGAVYIDLYAITNTSLSSNGDTFTGNIASGNGGAFYSINSIALTFTGDSFGSATLAGNQATLGSGGALYVAGATTIDTSNFYGNTAFVFGGAIYDVTNQFLQATNSSFIGNSAYAKGVVEDDGAAIFSFGNTNISVDSTNTFTDNIPTGPSGMGLDGQQASVVTATSDPLIPLITNFSISSSPNDTALISGISAIPGIQAIYVDVLHDKSPHGKPMAQCLYHSANRYRLHGFKSGSL